MSLRHYDEAFIKKVVLQTPTLTEAAATLGVPLTRLSQWLHRGKRIEWWTKVKTARSKEKARERVRRYRERVAARNKTT